MPAVPIKKGKAISFLGQFHSDNAARFYVEDFSKGIGFRFNDEGYDIGHLFHTIFTLLGINPRKERYRHKGQKLAIAHDDCELIKEVMQ